MRFLSREIAPLNRDRKRSSIDWRRKETRATQTPPKPGEEEEEEEDGDALGEGESRPEAEEGAEDRLNRSLENEETAAMETREKMMTNPKGRRGRRREEEEERAR